MNRKPNKSMAYVGSSAFSHKGGLHASAVKKNPKTYEHIDPKLIGNHRNIIVSNQTLITIDETTWQKKSYYPIETFLVLLYRKS